MLKRPKISVIGAGGNVGASVVQWCSQKELGDLVLIDLKPNVAQGRALDLSQGGAYAGFNAKFTSSQNISDIEGSDIVVVTAGVPRKPGQTREELVGINASIIKDISNNVKKFAPECILIIVSNPLDAMLTVAKKVTEFSREKVIGMSGVLDSSRFRNNIAQALNVSIKDVAAIVIGAHTDKDMVPVVSTATAGCVPVTKLLSKDQIQTIVEHTKRGGAELTELIGTSAWVAPGFGVTAMIESIVLNQGRILPCSVELTGEYGYSEGTCLCVPVKLTSKGAEKVIEMDLSSEETEAFKKAYEAYLEVRKIALSAI
ncbi:MAG: malate dehydrogenase [Silvanigrellaceae bacterium]|nr:malate dehydrogenase [Silvanigrellaceae bacterium]